MARISRRRGDRREIDAKAAPIHQIDKKVLRNRMAPLEPLDAEQLEIIHDLSLRILEEEGIEVMGAHALSLFRKAGAIHRNASTRSMYNHNERNEPVGTE